MKRIVGVTFLLFIFSFGMPLADDSQSRHEKTRDRYEEVTRDIHIKKKEREGLQKEERSLLDRLDRLALTLDQKSRGLRSLERQISQTRKDIASLENEMSRLRDQRAITWKKSRTRVAALYRISKVGPWAFLLSTENYADFLRMFTVLHSMMDHDIRLLTEFQRELEEKEALQKKLAAVQGRLHEKRNEARLAKQEIENLERQKKRALGEVRGKKIDLAKLVEELEKEAERLQSLLETPPEEGKTSSRDLSGFSALKGRLPLPVAGKLETNVQRRGRSITLKASQGETIRAVYRGRVVYAGWLKGYGNLLIIYHGDSFHTVMGYASELLKERDDWVEAGEPVARVGDTGSLGGPSLHFEIRRGKKALNPLEWFSREDQMALR